MMSPTNIEMLDDIIAGRQEWLEHTQNGTVCCGEGYYPGCGGCFRNPLQICVYVVRAKQIIQERLGDGQN